jgi:hypothetical protein
VLRRLHSRGLLIIQYKVANFRHWDTKRQGVNLCAEVGRVGPELKIWRELPRLDLRDQTNVTCSATNSYISQRLLRPQPFSSSLIPRTGASRCLLLLSTLHPQLTLLTARIQAYCNINSFRPDPSAQRFVLLRSPQVLYVPFH